MPAVLHVKLERRALSCLEIPSPGFDSTSPSQNSSTDRNSERGGTGVLLLTKCSGPKAQSMQASCRFNCGTMTPFFISRVFEEHASPKCSLRSESVVPGQMGFQSFVDFWLAWDHRSAPSGVRYFFPVFDLHHNGRLTQVKLPCQHVHPPVWSPLSISPQARDHVIMCPNQPEMCTLPC